MGEQAGEGADFWRYGRKRVASMSPGPRATAKALASPPIAPTGNAKGIYSVPHTRYLNPEKKGGLGAANNFLFVFPWALGVWRMGRSAVSSLAAFWPSCPGLRAAIGQAGREDLDVSREDQFHKVAG